MKKIVFILVFIISALSFSQNTSIKIALVKYNGGGDWYSNPTSLPNLVKFCNKNINTNIDPEIATVEVGSAEIYNYPFVHITGHGNIIFSDKEAENLRTYLLSGGFLHISDNYGLDKYIRTEMKKVFPESEFIELPFNHPIYHQKYNFNNGLPKIHKHDDKPARGLAIIYQGKLLVFYDFESDLGDGWEDTDVHNDNSEKRQDALKMGANIISFVFSRDR